jgi:hypothetical protein
MQIDKMTEKEIEAEIAGIYNSKEHNDRKSNRLHELLLALERIKKEIHFHFQKNISIAQIQNFAKTVNSLSKDSYILDEVIDSITEWPDECCSLQELKQNLALNFFFISTPKYQNLEYCTQFRRSLPDMQISLQLFSLQRNFAECKENQWNYKLIFSMTNSFILSNTLIGSHLYFNNYNLSGFKFGDKWTPSTIYIDELRLLHFGVDTFIRHPQKEKFETLVKYLILGFACQCRYTALWSCLLDQLSFPGLNDVEKNVFNKIAGWLLENLENPNVFHISVEPNAVNSTKDIENRGADDNTTRLKIYYGLEFSDECYVLRLDLPHKGEPKLHINIDSTGEKSKHIYLTDDNVDDHIFDGFCELLTNFNYEGSSFYSSPKDVEQKLFHAIKYFSAMINFCPYLKAYLLGVSHQIDGLESNPIVIKSRNVLKELLTKFDTPCEHISDGELFEYADILLEEHFKDLMLF